MKAICGARGAGKTRELIKLAAEDHSYIAVMNRSEAKRVADMADEMGSKIPFPITYDELDSDKFSRGVRGIGIVIDNIDNYLMLKFRRCNVKGFSGTLAVQSLSTPNYAGEGSQ